MKPAIHWTLIRKRFTLAGYEVIAVTSIKGRMIYGRKKHGDPTHCPVRDCLGTFATEEAAIAVVAQLKAVIERNGPLFDALRIEENSLYQSECEELQAIVMKATGQ